MKKIISVALALLFVFCCAIAEDAPETRVSVIEGEGIREEIVETLYTSEYGYNLWYPAELLAPVDMKAVGEKDGAVYMFDVFVPAWYLEVEEEVPANELIYMMIVPTDVPVEYADDFLLEATGGFDPGVAVIGEARELETDTDTVIKTIDVEENGVVFRYYLVMNAERMLCITTTFPVDALEGYAIHIERLVASINFAEITAK